MRADVHSEDSITFHEEDRAQVGFDDKGVNGLSGFGGEGVDLVDTEPLVERMALKIFQARRTAAFWRSDKP